jgi:beta-phosphoglucomutase-like phosphatase (HAD superfamily)
MIKLIIFDLDGVLVEAKEIHYQTLNDAIEYIVGDDMVINIEEHLSIYDGKKTMEKLRILTERKGLHPTFHQRIFDTKQAFTLAALRKLSPDIRLQTLMEKLKSDGYILAVCSNSIVEPY